MWPFKKKRKIVGYITEFPALNWYRKWLDGEITTEEYGKKNMSRIRTPIYEDGEEKCL